MLTNQYFGLGYSTDKKISLWCYVSKIDTDHIKFRVVNGGWDGEFYSSDQRLVCISPWGNTEHKVTKWFLDPIPKFRHEYYNEAIEWMNGELEDPTPYLAKELPPGYFDDMDDDIPF